MARSRFAAWLVAVSLALVTTALYWPTTGHDFVNFEDSRYVYQNAHVRSGLNWQNIQWAFSNLDVGLWHPLTWVSHMLDCQWFGLRPGRHHLTSLLLHAANSVLVFVVLRRMTGARWRSALVAAFFALHPLHVESVAWAAERKDVLSTFFFMLTLWAYARYAEGRRPKAEENPNSELRSPEPEAGVLWSVVSDRWSVVRGLRSVFYLLALASFACGLMSKPMVVSLPLVLLLLDYWPLKRLEPAAFVSRPSLAARLLLEKLPFVLPALITGLITLHGGNRHGALPSIAECPIPDRIANATLSYARYLMQVFWPGDLAVFYPLPATFSVWSVTGAALLLLGISVTAFCMARWWPYVVVGWLWYLATLLPVIGLIQLAGYSHADRYTYVPLIGVFVLLAWGAHDLTKRWPCGVMALSVAASAAIVLCPVLTRQQLRHWKDSEALFRHALEVTENNYLAHNNLGDVLDKKGRTGEAIALFQQAINLQPGYAPAHNNLGAALYKKGQVDEAISHFQEAIRLKPDDAEALNNLGIARYKQGQVEEAISHYREAIRLKPDHASAHNNLGTVLEKQGQTDEAISQYREAIRLKRDHADAHNNLGNALAKKGQMEEAISQYQEAVRLKPDTAETHYNLGNALAKKGQIDEAISEFQEALRLKPDAAETHYNLGNALAEKGQIDEAIRHYQEAIRLQPDDAETHYNLGIALYRKGRIDEAIHQYQDALRLKPDFAEAHNNLGTALDNKGQTDAATSHYREALRLKPDFFQSHLALAQILVRSGRFKDAAFHMEEFLRTCPRMNLEAANSPVLEPAVGALNNLGWFLATRPSAEDRDGVRAVRFAERACELTGRQIPVLLGTLAAAYAEAGRFKEAIETAQQARALAQSAGQAEVAEKNRQLLELYRSGKAYRELPPPENGTPRPTQ